MPDRTLPEVCRDEGKPLDRMRRLLRTPELRGLGRRIGPVRVFSEVEVEKLKAAYAAWAAAKLATATV